MPLLCKTRHKPLKWRVRAAAVLLYTQRGMSLKAKIEAVIYASEEPVTLAQLMGLLGHEAQAELDQMASAQQVLALSQNEAGDAEGSDADALNAEVLDAPIEAVDEEQPGTGEGATVESSPAEEAPAQQSEAAGDEDAEKRSARQAREEKEKARRLREYFRSLLDQLMGDYANGDRGLEIREVASGYRLATKPEYHDAGRGFVKSPRPPLKLSLQALETLAVVAYNQPVTAPEVSEIRGVASGAVLGSLMTRKLIATAGRKQVIGRPILYKTTREFLLRFGLKDINELPSIEEFEKMAGELAEQEEIPMEHHAPETANDLEPEKNETEPQ